MAGIEAGTTPQFDRSDSVTAQDLRVLYGEGYTKEEERFLLSFGEKAAASMKTRHEAGRAVLEKLDPQLLFRELSGGAYRDTHVNINRMFLAFPATRPPPPILGSGGNELVVCDIASLILPYAHRVVTLQVSIAVVDGASVGAIGRARYGQVPPTAQMLVEAGGSSIPLPRVPPQDTDSTYSQAVVASLQRRLALQLEEALASASAEAKSMCESSESPGVAAFLQTMPILRA